jgi:hypothetical protein
MQVEIKQLDIVSVVKVCFVIYAVIGIIVGLVFFIVTAFTGAIMGQHPEFGPGGLSRIAVSGLGILLVPLFAVMYGCIGAVAGLIVSLVYNIISKVFGGIRLTLVKDTITGAEPVDDKGMEVRL